MAKKYKCKKECTIRVSNFDSRKGSKLDDSYLRIKKGAVLDGNTDLGASIKHFKVIGNDDVKPKEESESEKAEMAAIKKKLDDRKINYHPNTGLAKLKVLLEGAGSSD